MSSDRLGWWLVSTGETSGEQALKANRLPFSCTLFPCRRVPVRTKDFGWEPCLIELTLPDALHPVRSLSFATTNATPHERLFCYNRKSTSGIPLPTSLTTPLPVLLFHSARSSKYAPHAAKLELFDCNSKYADVRFQDEKGDIVSLRNSTPSDQHKQAYSENTLAINARTSTRVEEITTNLSTVIQ